jgi:alcohol dehydrogenase class IV
VALAVAALAAAGVLTWALWPQHRPRSEPRAREYLAYTACLLTDVHGVTGDQAATVWAGMQDASLATHAKIQYLPVTGEPTAANALTHLGSLTQRHCDLIVAVGPAQVAAVDHAAARYPTTRFVTVTTGTGTASAGAAIPTPMGSATPTGSRSAAPTTAIPPVPVTVLPWTTAAEVRRGIDTTVHNAVRHATR